MTTLRLVYIFLFILHCHGQPVFDCPKPVGYGESANLTCSNLKEGGTISNSAETRVVNCIPFKCHVDSDFHEKINASLVHEMILLTVHMVTQTDEGEWECRSGNGFTKCSLDVYKLPSCNITSSTSTNDLTIGQNLTLNINLSDYYCTNNIAWKLQIGDKYQNITEFREVEETDNITNRAVTYSPTVTSSLTGRVDLTFNCDDVTYAVSCSGVQELELRDPPSCTLSSDNNTDTLTIGNELTLEADIDEYPCTSGIEFALLSGSVMVTDFLKSDKMYYAKFEVKQEYLDNQLHLKYTCNNVSETTETKGVTILLTKGSQITSSNNLGLIIGLSVGACFIIIITTVIICRIKRNNTTGMNDDAPYSDVQDSLPGRKCCLKVTCNDMYTEVKDITGSLQITHFECNDGKNKSNVEKDYTKVNRKELTDLTNGLENNVSDQSRPRSECVMIENVAHESVDRFMLIKAKENGKLLNSRGDNYAEVDKRRSQDIGGPVVSASAHV